MIVVASARSGSYRDVAMLAASIVSFVLLAFMLYSPWTFPPLLVLVDLLVVWPLLVWAFDAQWFLRIVVPSRRKRAQAQLEAEAEFVREEVHGTPNHTGVLVYVSALEGRIVVVPDHGITGRVAPGELAGVLADFSHDDLDHFVKGLKRLGDVLARRVPHTADSDAIDLPNAPRVRP